MGAGVYLHIPFCKSRCSYCDFATDVYRDSDAVDRYVAALCTELGIFQSETAIHADTIYFGGGTPSLLTASQVERILNSVRRAFVIANGAEITMEMNPATVSEGSLAAYRSLGINRASFGVQSFDDRQLRLLARGHDVKDAHQTFRLLREAGFANISFDLIAGLPDQTLERWERDLDEAVALAPEHISLYILEIHSGTPLAEQLSSGRRSLPDEEVVATMYENMLDKLSDAGYEQYEISNFCRPGFRARHNTKYWQMEPVFGFGVSAHSFDGRQRYANERDSARFVHLIEKGGSAEVMREDIDVASEAMFLGLRLEEGIDLAKFTERFGAELFKRNSQDIEQLRDAGLLAIGNGQMKLTRRGKLFSNEVFSVFV